MYAQTKGANTARVCGCTNQNATVTASAAALASHARIQGRSSARRTDRPSTTKKIAIVSSETICAIVLHR